MKRTVLISGVTGQDGSYLADLFLDREDKVIGIKRRSSTNNNSRIKHLIGHPNFELITGDVTDTSCIYDAVYRYQPDMVFSMAAMSHVHVSFNEPIATTDIIVKGTYNFLEAIKRFSPHTRFYHSASSEQFGANVDEDGHQRETTPFNPQSPYAVAKVSGYNITRLYRKMGVFACNGILFNHTGPRRGEDFVCKKIIKYIGYLEKTKYRSDKKPDKLKLGNIHAYRDFGSAKDFCGAAIKILEHSEPDDYVVATGEAHSIEEFVAAAFNYIGIDDWQKFVEIDSSLYRPAEVNYLCGDATKASEVLGWTPSTTFESLISEMIEHEIHSN